MQHSGVHFKAMPLHREAYKSYYGLQAHCPIEKTDANCEDPERSVATLLNHISCSRRMVNDDQWSSKR